MIGREGWGDFPFLSQHRWHWLRVRLRIHIWFVLKEGFLKKIYHPLDPFGATSRSITTAFQRLDLIIVWYRLPSTMICTQLRWWKTSGLLHGSDHRTCTQLRWWKLRALLWVPDLYNKKPLEPKVASWSRPSELFPRLNISESHTYEHVLIIG